MLEKWLLRPVLTFLLKCCFRIEVSGIEHYHAAGSRVLIAANHQSFLDPLIIAVFLPVKPAFAINVFQAEKWYFSWLDKIITLYRLDPSKPLSMKRLIQDLRKDAHVVIFPEGRITTSGGIMKIYDGTGMIVEKTGATVLPVRIDGAEYSKVSRLGRRLRQRWFPKVRMTILPPVRFEPAQPVPARAIYDVMTDAAFAASNHRQPLLAAMLDAYRRHGGKHVIACDIARSDMNYRQLFTRAFILRQALQKQGLSAGSRAEGDPVQPLSGSQDFVGLLLPNSLAVLVTFTALHMLGKIPCMLNFSAGPTNILHACRIATVKTVLTSRAFVEQGKLQHIIAALQEECVIIYLEDIRPTVTFMDKLAGFCHALYLGNPFIARRPSASVLNDASESKHFLFWPLPIPGTHKVLRLYGQLARTKPDDPAVILYTSGSEGTPKGVALSHANILANIQQARARLDLMPTDIFFNALPVFHSFGLTAGMLLPTVLGLKTFLYPSPLHYRVIPELVYDTDATIMLGTDTFYNGYARYANPYDFWDIRLAVAGAEKLKESTRHLYAEKFHLHIFEGYGVTEASPVIAVNTPLQRRAGTVGRPLPAIECRLEKVEGLEQGGRLFIKGPNVMLGYLKADKPGEIQPHDEWYDTGDIVDIDAEGFIRILGRAKRFAKIGGEMVSLLAVEELAAGLMPEVTHAAIAIADDFKGEKIVLFTEAQSLSKEQLIPYAREKGVAEICLPKHVIFVEEIPRLGNGKIDYPALAQKLIVPSSAG